ncbi:hypothetical protein NQZ79_g1444 [Umbelopsis isabellina]|nr:hypothetical protein NQZ79_g1444 [Umbelopsis isabellina]
MILTRTVPALLLAVTSVLGYGYRIGKVEHNNVAADTLPSDVMAELDALIDKLLNTSSTEATITNTDTDTTTDTSDTAEYAYSKEDNPFGDVKIDPYINISKDDKWCPHGEGNYCGEYIGKSASELWHCSVYSGKAHWTREEVCSKGCKAQPAEYDDHCAAESDCPHGDGMYCGKTLNKNLHHLYRCTSGVLKDMGYCPNGCKQTADGISDSCHYASGDVTGFTINALTLQKLKSHIGYNPNMNQKSDYKWQIGYGHLCEPYSVCQGIQVPVNETMASSLLSDDLKDISSCVCDAIRGKNLTDNQYGALVDYTYSQSNCDNIIGKSIDSKQEPSEIFGDDVWGQELTSLWKQSSDNAAPC